MAGLEELKDDLKRLEQSEELKDYLNSHKGANFVSAFFISDYENLDKAAWTLEYYWPKTGRVTTFTYESCWKVSGDDKILQKENKALEKLDVNSVKCRDGLEKATAELRKSYKAESPSKVIVILNSQDNAPFWNITFFTKSFRLINFKIDAVSGDIKSSAVDNLFQLGKK